jgi:hypothetical protein
VPGWETRLDIERSDIVIQGSSPKKIPRKEVRIEPKVIVELKYEITSIEQDFAELLLLRFLQRWGKEFLRRRLSLNVTCDATDAPRHLPKHYCPCQFVEEVFKSKVSKLSVK